MCTNMYIVLNIKVQYSVRIVFISFLRHTIVILQNANKFFLTW
jgi:hypothetical protein